MGARLNDAALDTIFRTARTYNAWQPKPVPEAVLREAWDLARMGLTSANCSPARITFVVSAAAKERLKPSVSPGNLAKTMAAPATAIIAYDLDFYTRLPELFPQNPAARSWYEGKPEAIQTAAFRNGSLQAAYFMIAARAVGLDCGPMSGFDNAKLDQEFFAGTQIKSNILCNLAYGDPTGLRPRSPRLDFDDACRIL